MIQGMGEQSGFIEHLNLALLFWTTLYSYGSAPQDNWKEIICYALRLYGLLFPWFHYPSHVRQNCYFILVCFIAFPQKFLGTTTNKAGQLSSNWLDQLVMTRTFHCRLSEHTLVVRLTDRNGLRTKVWRSSGYRENGNRFNMKQCWASDIEEVTGTKFTAINHNKKQVIKLQDVDSYYPLLFSS